MGDRAMIVVQNGDERVYLYSHWCGYEMPKLLSVGLKAGADRWDDSSYLARVLLNAMQGTDRSTTGFGIWVRPMDWEHPWLLVDTDKLTVSVVKVRHDNPRDEAVVLTEAISDYVIRSDDRLVWEALA
jgi:hypothetical protein